MRRRVKKLRPGPSAAGRAKAKLLADLEDAHGAGDVELEKALLRIGRDRGWIENPGPHAHINDAIRRAHGRPAT